MFNDDGERWTNTENDGFQLFQMRKQGMAFRDWSRLDFVILPSAITIANAIGTGISIGMMVAGGIIVIVIVKRNNKE